MVRITRPVPCELSYLSWGRRYYGEPALKPTAHEGWHYFLVLAGNPALVMDGKDVVTQPGSINIGHPDALIGHADEPGHSCQMLTWIWRTPPAHSALRPDVGGHMSLMLDAEQVRRLQQLHLKCRDAVADSDERSMLQLRSARLLIDLCLLEAQENRRQADAGMRIELAIQYLRSHVGEKQSVAGLCEYLQVSKASLYRLFFEYTGKGPRAFSQDVRMQWAREQLEAKQKSAKAVAYALGYRHPPDFSRAFKHHFGITASCVLRDQLTLDHVEREIRPAS